ncbi:hypothetical protein [Streptomyces sp. SAJ15]|uniref:hypothetical protein n=1 Tax=Streptomyces sp. SAJ15 TaxID=2011095 RepID=UPI00164366B0|nr:hypothetical protein [Streptomyces sp. SAJ15]
MIIKAGTRGKAGHMSDGGPQGLGVLKTNNPGKAAAVKALTEDIQPDTGTAGTVADEKAFATAAAKDRGCTTAP